MTTFERSHVESVVRCLRTEETPRRVVAVTGPRQTGKTTIIRQALERAGLPHRYVPVDQPRDPLAGPPRAPDSSDATDFERGSDPSRDRSWLIRLWERARQEAKKTDHGFVLALDEIQYVEGSSGVVKGLWDQDQFDELPLRVILSGSAPWSMLTGRGRSDLDRRSVGHRRRQHLGPGRRPERCPTP